MAATSVHMLVLMLALLPNCGQAQSTAAYSRNSLEQQTQELYAQLSMRMSGLEQQLNQTIDHLRKQMVGRYVPEPTQNTDSGTGSCCSAVEELVSGPHGVADSQLTASTQYDARHGPHRCRLHYGDDARGTGSWSSKTKDQNQWIQVDFNRTVTILGLMTKGRGDSPHAQWVTAYKVLFSNDGLTWIARTDDRRNPQIFPGNYNSETPVTNSWYLQGQAPIQARMLQLRPTGWNGHISLRLGVLGCG